MTYFYDFTASKRCLSTTLVKSPLRLKRCPRGGMVDTSDSKSDVARRGGSSPPAGTTYLYFIQNLTHFIKQLAIILLNIKGEDMTKIFIGFLTLLFINGCQSSSDTQEYGYTTSNEQIPLEEEKRDILVGQVREYDSSNEANRVNIFITLGQSNSAGRVSFQEDNFHNVLMPEQNSTIYPETFTFKRFTRLGSNMIIPYYRPVNLLTEFSEIYDLEPTLYAFNISFGGQAINFELGNDRNQWSPYRIDNDGWSMHPQTISYIQNLITQLQNEGKEPYVIAVDWNQWEAEDKNWEISQFYKQYMWFFDTLETVIPNKDYKLFLCNPTAELDHRDKVRAAFKLLESRRKNVFIYKPDTFGIDNIWDSERQIHYNAEVFDKMAEIVYNEIKRR